GGSRFPRGGCGMLSGNRGGGAPLPAGGVAERGDGHLDPRGGGVGGAGSPLGSHLFDGTRILQKIGFPPAVHAEGCSRRDDGGRPAGTPDPSPQRREGRPGDRSAQSGGDQGVTDFSDSFSSQGKRGFDGQIDRALPPSRRQKSL